LSFFSTVTVFGTAVEITLAEISLEAFYPADDFTAGALKALLPTKAAGKPSCYTGLAPLTTGWRSHSAQCLHPDVDMEQGFRLATVRTWQKLRANCRSQSPAHRRPIRHRAR
jgi:hypothetical protein